jgi:AmiR/NasT family two-component response regulator
MLTVVVMDGNAISRGLLISVLVSGGHDVVGDSNVTVMGIAKMVKLKPQLVCMDLGAVEGDKLEVLDNLRKELPKTIFFLVSNSFDAESIRLGQEHGVKGFIVKPFNTVRVLTSIRNAVIKFVMEMKQSQQSGDAPPDVEELGSST